MTEVSSYDPIAAEYYDPAKHPTCADFRDATAALLDEFLSPIAAAPLPCLEIGAGKSLLAEAFQARGWPIAGLTLTDASPAMLAHSNGWAAEGARLIPAAIEALDLPAGGFRAIFACLGDPFNDADLWQNIERWLAPQGICFFSSPAHEWAARYRPAFQSGQTGLAEFIVNGKTLAVSSTILPQPAQTALIESAGLRVSRISSFTHAAFGGRARSPKINLPGIADDTPIVTAYIAEKPPG
jgi:SAM-dependent methyltransferase